MTDWSFILDPALPLPAIIAFALVVAVLVGLGLLRRRPGAWLRALALVIMVLALLDPSIRLEQRERQPTVIAVVTDESASQAIADRQPVANSAADAITAQLGDLAGVSVRTLSVTTQDEGTLAFGPIETALADVPREQLGGVVLLTDGQIADAPQSQESNPLPADVPIHALLTGTEGEGDRRIELLQVPRFTLVDRRETVRLRIVEDGVPLGGDANPTAALTIFRDNEIYAQDTVPIGAEIDVPITVERAGDNLFEIRIEPVPGELTDLNNQAVFSVEGVRDTLRVLLVSGQPHAGERTWRNLLKSDPAVDLVHFTILRPPEKQDGTPIGELSLIAFPTRELFVERINDFDLIILDRYQRRSVLPLVYFDNIADYVRRGGALLIAAGPEFADETSIAFTALADILPVFPTGAVSEVPFHPQVSEVGRRHPITRGLEGMPSAATPEAVPDWSRWFRLIAAEPSAESLVAMRAPSDAALPQAPLLALDSVGDGRVGVLLSDHIWLWARNFEGGGPHVQLLRRLAHWLMREPDLEEETLTAAVRGERMTIERRTLEDSIDPITVVRPSGAEETVTLDDRGEGLFARTIAADEIGLWRLSGDTLTTLTHVGPPNPDELQHATSTSEILEPVADFTGGAVQRLVGDTDTVTTGEVEPSALAIPRTRLVDSGARASGAGWIGFRRSEASILIGAQEQPLTLGLWTLLPALLLWGATWWREGR
ncbi:MAG: hypothetical protein KI785_09345 [Devosiaceae bacterium]|nr:hypothetical protein [Devosiaceae bacterium MH13]